MLPHNQGDPPVMTEQMAQLLESLAEKQLPISDAEVDTAFQLISPHTRFSAAAGLRLFRHWTALPEMHRAAHFLGGLLQLELGQLPVEIKSHPQVSLFFDALEEFVPGYFERD